MVDADKQALLTVAEMYRADALAANAGVSGEALMEAAGAAVAAEVQRRWSRRPVVALCGPGNNGGDGFVAARLLKEAGWPVTVALLGEAERLKGDAARVAKRWNEPVASLSTGIWADKTLVIDALFGAGLGRPVEGVAADVLTEVAERRLPCVAVDIPSGVHGDTGEMMGVAAPANVTVTFFRKKPGHLLLPGRALCGEVIVADIGIPEAVLEEIGPKNYMNAPPLWLDGYPWPRLESHKYSRGHAVVVGGETTTGAARLAARGAMRMGAGLVTIASPPAAQAIYATSMAGALIAVTPDLAAFRDMLSDPRKNAVLLGPGGGLNEDMREQALAALGAPRAVVLDADALTVFQKDPEALFAATRRSACVLTPHDGEFARVFAVRGDKVSRARAAAAKSGAVVLLKGADTVIAAPDGRVAINANAPPELATAGSGDVLAGMVVGLMAQGMTPFDAARAAVWAHGAAAGSIGSGLIAEDLPEALPRVLRRLKAMTGCFEPPVTRQ